MDLSIEKLSEKNLYLLDSFCCVETDEQLLNFSSKVKRRIRIHSKEMEEFLKNEAYSEQIKGLNTTHLFIDNETKEIIAYVSLCTDSLLLDFDEKNELGLTYSSIPAVKIARLAVSNKYRNMGIGSYLLMFSAFQSFEMRKYCGVSFLTLDCYEHRISFYKQHGFVENIIQPVKLPFDSPISMRISLDDYLERIADNPKLNVLFNS